MVLRMKVMGGSRIYVVLHYKLFNAVEVTTSHSNDLSNNKVDKMKDGFKVYQVIYSNHILKLHW